MKDYPDNELIDLVCDNNEFARDIVYKKYVYIVDIIINKYKKSAYYLSVDLTELRQEALVGFSDALNCYNTESNTSLSTFISICVERRVENYLRKADTLKNKVLREAYSLDMPLGESNTLGELIGDTSLDPSRTVEEEESLLNLKKQIDELLSPAEKEVYELLINGFSCEDIASILNKNVKQVYNTLHRLRTKIKEII